MNNQNNLNTIKTIERKKFFSKLGKSFMGLIVVSSFPYTLFGRNNSTSKKVKIEINPLAVKRDKDIRKNG